MPLLLPEQITADRIYLQRQRPEFAEEIFFAYASKPEATKFVSWPTHQSIQDTRTYLRFAVAEWEMGHDYSYAIRLKTTHRLIGSIGATNEDGNVQIGYIFSPAFWGQGYATEACAAFVSQLKSLSDVYRVWSFTDCDNGASQKVLLKCGFVEEARLAKWFRFINQGNVPKDCIFYTLPMQNETRQTIRGAKR
jgi:[ribosomal protein S5]-alanine N-acetyltransferase